MGVDVFSFDFLLKFRGRRLGETLWLGRQGFHMPRNTGSEDSDQHRRGQAMRVLAQYDPHQEFDSLGGQTGYAEALFSYLGSTSIAVMDNSPFEGADLIHDLNTPVDPSLHSQFDCIFDGGTLEHVFNIPVAMDNIKSMLRVGGLFISINGANNFFGHGFYQFSPELMWRVFSRKSGFEVETMGVMDTANEPALILCRDPASTGERDHIPNSAQAVYLMMAARKTREVTEAVVPQQSDYQAAWAHAAKVMDC